MTHQLEIDAAISAHELWKSRLQEAVHSHTIDVPIERIARDDCCEFGAWLYSDNVTESEKKSQRYVVIQYLHSDFHKAAAEVALHAVNGQPDDAIKLMSDSGKYTVASKRLIAALRDWRRILKPSSSKG